MGIIDKIDEKVRDYGSAVSGSIGKKKDKANVLKCVFLYPSSNLEVVDLEMKGNVVVYKGGKDKLAYIVYPKGIIRFKNIAYGFWFYNNPNMISFDYSTQTYDIDSATAYEILETKVLRDAVSDDIGEHDTLILVASIVAAIASVVTVLYQLGILGKDK